MFGFNHKHIGKLIMVTSAMLVYSSVSTAQVPPGPQVPPPPPPPEIVIQPVEDSDNEVNRRRSALVSCCLRRAEGVGAYCSIEQLNAAVRTGDLIRREKSDGSLYCAEGTGTVVSRAPRVEIEDAGQALISPLEPVEGSEIAPSQAPDPLNSLFQFLFGFDTAPR